MSNRITTLFDFSDNGGIKAIQKQIAATEGTINKVKVAAKGAFDSFRQSNVQQAAAIAGVGIVASQAISAASDLEESINAVNLTFGDAADQILQFGENAATSVGLARSEFNQLATPLGAMLKNAGLEDFADQTIVLTQRAADMASVFNKDVSEALTAIQAGLRGEQDPLEQFGVKLSAAAIEARALADTGKDTAKSLTEQEKALARINLILEQTDQTAGDFKNTSDGLANSQRQLSAQWKDLQAEIGEDLVPALLTVVQGLQAIIDVSEKVHLDDALDMGWVESTGKTIGNLLSPWNAAARRANKDVADAFKESENAAEGFDRSLLEGLSTFDQVRAKVLELTESEHAANLVALEWAESHKEVADSTTAASGAMATLGDRIERVGQSIPEIIDGFREAGDAATDNFAAKVEEAAERVRSSIEETIDAVNAPFDELREDLDLSKLLDDIEEGFIRIEEAAAKSTDGTVESAHRYNDAVRSQQAALARLFEDYANIPASKTTEIIAKIKAGDLESLREVFAELSRGVVVPIIFGPSKFAGLSSIGATFAPGQAPQTDFNTTQPAIPPGQFPQQVNNGTTIINYPVGTSPTSVTVDGRTYDRRNGAR